MSLHINDLPTEVLRSIFLYLEPPAFLRASQTCQHWRRLAHWNYVLLWHIDARLTDAENEHSIFKLYSQVCMPSGNDGGEKSKVLNHYLDSLNETTESQASTPTATPAANSPSTNGTASKTIDSSKLIHLSISKIYELSTQNSEQGLTGLKVDQSLVLFYHKLLQLKLIGLTLQPLYRIVASSTSFFPNHLVEDQQTAHYVDECVSLSPDGTLLLSVKRNKTNDHFLSITALDDGSPNFSIPYLKSVYSWRKDRNVSDIVLSRDFHYLAVSYHVGYVEVHNLGTSPTSSFKTSPLLDFPVNVNGKSTFANSTHCLFQSQYPSLINYLGLTANGEVLFLRSQRLGGLIIVNLLTGEMIDIPHYRLDLIMSLQCDDKVLSLSGWNETIIFGKGTRSPTARLPKPGTLWDYYTNLIQNHLSLYVPVEKAMALERQNTYLGFDFSQQDNVSLKIIVDDEELIGYTSLENMEEEGDEAEDDEEQADPNLTPNRLEGEDGEDDDDPDEDPRRFCTILSRKDFTRSSNNYCLSPNGQRFAIVLDDRIYLYVLRDSTIDDAFAAGFLECRRFRVDLFKNIGSGRLSFVGNDKLLVITQDRIVMYELSSNIKWTKSGQQQFTYLKINADSNVDVI